MDAQSLHRGSFRRCQKLRRHNEKASDGISLRGRDSKERGRGEDGEGTQMGKGRRLEPMAKSAREFASGDI